MAEAQVKRRGDDGGGGGGDSDSDGDGDAESKTEVLVRGRHSAASSVTEFSKCIYIGCRVYAGQTMGVKAW